MHVHILCVRICVLVCMYMYIYIYIYIYNYIYIYIYVYIVLLLEVSSLLEGNHSMFTMFTPVCTSTTCLLHSSNVKFVAFNWPLARV